MTDEEVCGNCGYWRWEEGKPTPGGYVTTGVCLNRAGGKRGKIVSTESCDVWAASDLYQIILLTAERDKLTTRCASMERVVEAARKAVWTMPDKTKEAERLHRELADALSALTGTDDE